MGDAAPEFAERMFGSLPSAVGQTAGEYGRVDRAGARRADAFECNAFFLEQAVEDTQVKAPCAPPPCRARLIDLISTLRAGIR